MKKVYTFVKNETNNKMEFKGTKGEWTINRISGIATGIGVSEKVEGGTYAAMMCEFFLPDTDEEYEQSDIEANAKLIAAAPLLLEALQESMKELYDLMNYCVDQGFIDNEEETDGIKLYNKSLFDSQEAINKALN